MNTRYDFGILRAMRKRKNLTLEQLAERAELTYPTVASIENNKSLPSIKSLDAIAGVLELSTSNLLKLAERQVVRKRTAHKPQYIPNFPGEVGIDLVKTAEYDKARINRITAKAGDKVHLMGLHDDVHEFCYVLSGKVELRIEDKMHELEEDDTILFDAVLDHEYSQIEDGQYVTVHVPKDIGLIEALLDHVEMNHG